MLGRYCQVCGQENIEPSKSAWDLLWHFAADFFHFDGKFFRTIGTLFLRPGIVAHEYREGKRRKYLDPARMYIFTSAIFFLILFIFVDLKKVPIRLDYDDLQPSRVKNLPADSLKLLAVELGLPAEADSIEILKRADSVFRQGNIILGGKRFFSREEYDSAIESGQVTHNWFMRQYMYKQFELSGRYDTVSQAITDLMANWLHAFPRILFTSLPLFAFLLKLVYWRRRDVYYADHLVFGTYLYVMLFVFFGLLLVVFRLEHQLTNGAYDWLINLLLAGAVFYEYKSMRNFYHSSRSKTILKVFLINMMQLLLLLLLAGLFLWITLINL